MDKLKSSIEEANLAVSAEREKNVSLLHLIFPPDIAKRLWLGKLCNLNSTRVQFTSRVLHFLHFVFKFLQTRMVLDEVIEMYDFRRNYRGENLSRGDDAFQRYRRFHGNLFHRDTNDGHQYASKPLRAIRLVLWPIGRLQGEHF